jgi:hypothetical protein
MMIWVAMACRTINNNYNIDILWNYLNIINEDRLIGVFKIMEMGIDIVRTIHILLFYSSFFMYKFLVLALPSTANIGVLVLILLLIAIANKITNYKIINEP